MHPLQRRSLFAILSIAESAIQQMKSILAHDSGGEGDEPRAPVRQQSVSPGEKEYLSEGEEEAFERLLEEDRQRMLDTDAKRMSELWGQK